MPKCSMPTTSKASGHIWILRWRLGTGATDGSSCSFIVKSNMCLFSDAILRKFINDAKKNFVNFYISNIYQCEPGTHSVIFGTRVPKYAATKSSVLHLL